MPTKKRLTKKRVKRRPVSRNRSSNNRTRKIKRSRRKRRINRKNSNKTMQHGGYYKSEPDSNIPEVKPKGIADEIPPWPGSSKCKSDCFEVCTIL